MRLTVSQKLYLGLGLLLGLFVAASLLSYLRTRSVGTQIRRITEIDEPLANAALEMEISLIGTGFGLLGYLHDGDPLHQERIREDARDFETFHNKYQARAETQEVKDLGRRVAGGYARFRKRAAELIRIHDRQTQKLLELQKAFDEIDNVVDEGMHASIDKTEKQAYRKLEAALEIEINANQVARDLGLFLRTHDPNWEARTEEDAKDLERFLELYRGLALSSQEKRLALEVERLSARVLTLLREIVTFAKASRTGLGEFVQIRRELGHLLEDRIPALAPRDIGQGREAVRATLSTTNRVILSSLLAGLALGVFGAVRTARSITRPVGMLVSATQAFAQGKAPQRVTIASNDEFAVLGEFFNQMVEARLRAEVAVQKAYGELETPVRDRTAQLMQADQTPRGAVPGEGRGTETVLVVEDQEALREMIHEILDQQGYRVLAAAGGDAALDVARQHPGPVHLLLTDVVMPGMSGRELADRLAALRPEIRALYMSGSSDATISERGILVEGAQLLETPFTPESLARAVRRALDADPRICR